MTKSLQAAVDGLQNLAGGLTGIKSAPDDPPEAITQFPFVTTYPFEGEVEFQAAAWTTGLHKIVTEFHFSRVSLSKAVQQAIPFYEAFLAALQDSPTLGGAADSVNSFTYRFGVLEYAGTTTIGYQFTILVKINTPEG